MHVLLISYLYFDKCLNHIGKRTMLLLLFQSDEHITATLYVSMGWNICTESCRASYEAHLGMRNGVTARVVCNVFVARVVCKERMIYGTWSASSILYRYMTNRI